MVQTSATHRPSNQVPNLRCRLYNMDIDLVDVDIRHELRGLAYACGERRINGAPSSPVQTIFPLHKASAIVPCLRRQQRRSAR